jgi:nicotinamidase-related amidase
MPIDVQAAIDDPVWGRRGQPDAEANVARLLAGWRAAAAPILHVRHDSQEPQSPYRPDRPGNAFKPQAAPRPGEEILAKHSNSAFIGTDLERRLRDRGVGTLVICGVLLENSVEATVRMAGNLGFAVHLIADATASIDRRLHDGRMVPAEDVHALSLAILDGEYARVTDTATALHLLS